MRIPQVMIMRIPTMISGIILGLTLIAQVLLLFYEDRSLWWKSSK